MNIIFAGFRHSHIEELYRVAAKNAKVRITGCFEADAAARAAAAQNIGIEFSGKTYGELLADSAVDAVAIGAAYGDRGAMVIKALEAGKHIISDKPLCTSLKELEQIRRLAAAKNLKIGCMLDLRYVPTALKAKELLQSGKLGAVRNVSFTGQHYLNYQGRPKWYYEKGKHGGTINDIAIHGVDLIHELTGLKVNKINAARCWNAYAGKEPHFNDCAIFMAELDNGAGLLADVSYSAPSYGLPTYWNFKFWCERGLLTFHGFDKKVYVYETGRAEQAFDGSIPTIDYLDEFITEVEKGTARLTENVLSMTEVCLKIQKFADEKE